jgi:hypothetical protein
MNKDAAARIIDGKTLCYNSALVAELAIRTKGPKEGREAIRCFKEEHNAEDAFAPYAGALRLMPSELDQYAQALGIVKLIGRATREEAEHVDYDGDYKALF